MTPPDRDFCARQVEFRWNQVQVFYDGIPDLVLEFAVAKKGGVGAMAFASPDAHRAGRVGLRVKINEENFYALFCVVNRLCSGVVSKVQSYEAQSS